MGIFDNLLNKKEKKEGHNDFLDEVLYILPETKAQFTHANAVEATLITGAPGSGKTSAVAKYIAKAMLQKGYGICVLCAKPDEGEKWYEYAEKVGRASDVVWFKKGSGLEFNFLQYELNRTGEGAGDTLNITNYLMMLYELASNFQAGNGGGGNEDRFWDQSLRRLISRTVALLKFSKVELSMENLRRIVADCFNQQDWEKYEDLLNVIDELTEELTQIAKKETADEPVSKGKIVIVDFPVKEFGVSGLYASAIYKIMFQAAMERRKTEEEDEPRVVGLHIDEYQNFISPQHDSLFMATARSSMVACVFITQNIHNIIMCMGKENAEAWAKSLLANMGMKYFCSNNDFETNQYASNLIGEDYFEARDHTYSGDGFKSEVSKMELRHRLRPDEFTNLKTGRERNKFKVQAIAFKEGFDWKNKQNYAVVEFDQ